MERAEFALEIKSAGADGVITGLGSAYGNKDSDGEVIDHGAFADSIKKSGGVFPILWMHDSKTPIGHSIGSTVRETNAGLEFSAKLMIDTQAGQYAYSFLKSAANAGTQAGLSVGFSVPPGGDYYKSGVRHFKSINLKEVSVVLYAANPRARVLTAKAVSTLAGAVGALKGHLETALERHDKVGDHLDALNKSGIMRGASADHLAAAMNGHQKTKDELKAAYDSLTPIQANLHSEDVNEPNPMGQRGDDTPMVVKSQLLDLAREARELLLQ